MKENIKEFVEISKGNRNDYLRLAEYHYVKQKLPCPTDVFIIRPKNNFVNLFPEIIGVCVLCTPLPDIKARRAATDNFFYQGQSPSDRLKLVNQHIRYLARLIIDPRFRRLGLSVWLVKYVLKHVYFTFIETITPTDFSEKIFCPLGFKLFYQSAPTYYTTFTRELGKLNISFSRNIPVKAIHNRISALTKIQFDYVEEETRKFLNHFKHRSDMEFSLDRTSYICSKFPYPSNYYIWYNKPKIEREKIPVRSEQHFTSLKFS